MRSSSMWALYGRNRATGKKNRWWLRAPTLHRLTAIKRVSTVQLKASAGGKANFLKSFCDST